METTENLEFKEMKRSLIKTLLIIVLSVVLIVSLVPNSKADTFQKHKQDVSTGKIK